MWDNESVQGIRLHNGNVIPPVGFGTWQLLPGRTTKKAVIAALQAGYRLLDTARVYANESSVGKALRESHIARDEVFVTTKLWNRSQGYDRTLKAFHKSLARLDMDYIDLYLIHWPVSGTRQESWRALTEIYATGQAKNIGVSNYTIRHLEELLSQSNVVPAVNQVEFHPYLYEDQKDLLAFCKKHGITVEAYSPLTHGKKLDDKILPQIAKKHGKSSAQVLLRWCVQHGTVPLPKSSNPAHIKDNIDIFDFQLTVAEMEQINGLSDGTRTCWNPNNML